MTETIFTTEQVAKLAGMNRTSVYYYIRKGVLSPLYKDRWQQDGTLLFSEEEVEKFLEQHQRKGLTTGEVATKLGLTNAQVLSFIEKGTLKSSRVSFGQVEWNIISNEELLRFQETHLDVVRKGRPFTTKDKKFNIFQLVEEPLSSQFARIIEIDENGEDGKVQFANGNTLSLLEIRERGFQVAHVPSKRTYSKKPGVIIVKMPVPEHIGHPIYKAIDFLYQYVGTKNLKVQWSSELIKISIKPLLIELTDLEKERFDPVLKTLEQYVYEGNVNERHNGWLFSNNLESMTFYLPSELKRELQNQAQSEQLSMNDFLVKIIQNHLNKS